MDTQVKLGLRMAAALRPPEQQEEDVLMQAAMRQWCAREYRMAQVRGAVEMMRYLEGLRRGRAPR